MIPVDQTIFGDKKGNCFAACVASLLELPLEAVPNFCGDHEDWWEALKKWLEPRGFFPVAFEKEVEAVLDYVGKALTIVSGPGPRGTDHACVYQGKELAHDPHPSREGILGYKDVILLVPQDPAKARIIPRC